MSVVAVMHGRCFGDRLRFGISYPGAGAAAEAPAIRLPVRELTAEVDVAPSVLPGPLSEDTMTATRRDIRERIDPRLTATIFSNYRTLVDAVLELVDTAVDSWLPGRPLEVDLSIRPGTIDFRSSGVRHGTARDGARIPALGAARTSPPASTPDGMARAARPRSATLATGLRSSRDDPDSVGLETGQEYPHPVLTLLLSSLPVGLRLAELGPVKT